MLDKARRIVDLVRRGGAADVLYVGGYVRDTVRGKAAPKDIDIEVYGLPYDKLVQILAPHFDVKIVGESFGVIKVDNQLDVSIPRRENKIGKGHKGFQVTADPNMSIKEAAARRDFTINSMAMIPETGVIIDYYDGRKDLEAGILRATSPAYVEDPLRVLRGMQFAGRFGLVMEDGTIEMSRKLIDEYEDLAAERIWGEWWKWATKSTLPSYGLDVLVKTGWIQVYPELANILDIPQDPIWHPEGNVWKHTKYAADKAIAIAARHGLGEFDTGVLTFSALTHDVGKAGKTVIGDRITSPGHAEAGGPLAEAFLRSIYADATVIDQVPKLVVDHMAHIGLPDPSPRVVRRLATRLKPATVRMWAMVVEADHAARPPVPGDPPEPLKKYVRMAEEVNVMDSAPVAIVMGRHLLEIGLKPGPKVGTLLKMAYIAQLDGIFSDLEGGIKFVKDNLDNVQ